MTWKSFFERLLGIAVIVITLAVGWYAHKYFGGTPPVEVDRLIDPPQPCTHNGVPGRLGYREGKLWCFVTDPTKVK